MEGLIGDGERGEAVIENSRLELIGGPVEGLEELIGDRERGRAGNTACWVDCVFGDVSPFLGFPLLPRRHVATSPQEWPATTPHPVMRLKT